MPPKRTFDDLTDDDGSLGDDEGATDSSEAEAVNPSFDSPVPHLPLPTSDDDLETLEKKMAAFADVVKKGESLAERAGFQCTADATKDAETVATMSMSAEEKMWYGAWKDGSFKPTPVPFAQMKNKSDTVKKGALKEAEEEMATILSIMYKTPEITTAQTREWEYRVGKWKQHRALTSLYRAIDLVERQKVALTEMTNGVPDLTQDDLDELQTAKKIVTLATNRVTEVITQAKHSIQALKEDGIKIESSNIPHLFADIRHLGREIGGHSRPIQERLATLRAKTTMGKKKRAKMDL